MFFDEEVEKPASSSSRDKTRVRPAKSPKTEERLGSPKIQAHLDKTRAYKEQINNLLKSTSDQKSRARLQDLATQVNEWVKAIEDLAKRVNSFHQNTLINQDLESVPKSIAELEARLANESNQATRIELKRTLANRKNQLAALERLQNIINRAELKTESTLSALGTIYSQMLTAQSTNQVADYSRLSAEVDEEVLTLQDHLEALEEVKLGSG
jgi:archaellum component FlaC